VLDVCLLILSLSLSLSNLCLPTLSLTSSLILSLALSLHLSIHHSTRLVLCLLLSLQEDLSLAVSKMSCEAGISLRPHGVCLHVHDVIKHSQRTQQPPSKSNRCRVSNFYNGHSSMLDKRGFQSQRTELPCSTADASLVYAGPSWY
jgi:hypothetical protein